MSLLPLTQDITYWSIATVDQNMVITWNVGVAIKGRWVKKDGIVKDKNGKDQKTEFIVYADVIIPKRSMVTLDNKNGVALPPDGAREVVANVDNSSLSTLIKHVM